MAIGLQLFGGPRLHSKDGGVFRFPTKKSAALLAYLADSRGEAIPRESIATLLWPRSEQEQSRASLRQELAVLRKALGPFIAKSIDIDRDSLTFTNMAIEIDTHQFRQIAQQAADTDISAKMSALALYRLPFLSALRIRSEPFEDWVWSSGQYFQEKALSLGMLTLEYWQDQGATDKVIEVAQRLIDIDPSQEIAHRTLMDAYWSNGHKGLALRQFKVCQDTLERLLDVKPSHETNELAARILKADGSTSPRSRAAAQVSEPVRTEPTYEPFQERRVVSVLAIGNPVCDPDNQDPEEYEDTTSAFVEKVVKVVPRFGGQVISAGEGRILACFGYPVSSEHDSDRAVKTALFAINALKEISLGRIRCSCGIARERAVIKSRLIPAIDRALKPASGNSPTIIGSITQSAQRLEYLGAPDQILVDRATSNAMSGAVSLRLVPGRKDVFAAKVQDGFLARPMSQVPKGIDNKFVGRGQELDQLQRLLEEARLGHGQALLIDGEPGIGKSRLIQELQTYALSKNVPVYSFYGSPHETNTAFFPVAEYLRRNVLTRPTAQGDAPYLQLSLWLGELNKDQMRAAPYFASLLSLQTGPFAPTGDIPEKYGNLALEFLATLAANASRTNPALVVLEDVHWMDHTTIEAALKLIEVADEHPVFVVLVSRKGEWPAKLNHARLQKLHLERLLSKAALTLVEGLLPDVSLPPNVIENILKRAEGNPLILEEFSKSIGETLAALPDGLNRDLNNSLGTIRIPGSLVATLLSRIDRIQSAKPILQKAAVLGRLFSLNNLVAMTGKTPQEVLRSVIELEKAELIFRRSRQGELEFAFKHALTQEISYSTILKRHRPQLHQAAAEAILTNPPDDPKAGVIAMHYRSANLPIQAAEFFRQAGRKSVLVSAHHEAISHFKSALAMVRQGVPTANRTATELNLTRKIGAQMISIRGIPTPDVEEIYQLTCQLSDQLGDLEEIVNARWGIWGVYLVAGNFAKAKGVAGELIGLAKQSQAPLTHMIAQYVNGVNHAYQGDFPLAIKYLEQTLELYDPSRHGEMETRFGMNIGLTANCFLGWVRALTGQVSQADKASDNALHLAGQINNGFSQAFANVFSATKSLFLDRLEEGERYASQALKIASKQNFTPWRAQARIQLARLADLKHAPNALGDMRRALEQYMASGSVLVRPYAQVWIAEGLLRRGHFREALAEIDDLLDYTRESGQKYYDGEALWVKYQTLSKLEVVSGKGKMSTSANAVKLEALRFARSHGAGLLASKIESASVPE